MKAVMIFVILVLGAALLGWVSFSTDSTGASARFDTRKAREDVEQAAEATSEAVEKAAEETSDALDGDEERVEN